MRLIITDTNVLFDVIKIGALPEFFSLDFNICTTVFVIEEIKPSAQRELVETFIRAKKLIVFEFTGEDIEEVVNFDSLRGIKRFIDKSVIWKSVQLNCPMLTGDKKRERLLKILELKFMGVSGSSMNLSRAN